MIKTKHLVVSAFFAASVAIMAMAPERSSSGAPASHTGAPGDQTCATIGCHDDNSVNVGTANLTIDLGQASHYVPGQVYTIKVRMTDPSVERFGFQILALGSDNNNSVGTFKITDTYRTQITTNPTQLNGRHYVTYTFDGTDAVSSGVGEWTVNWKAPATDMGPVTFYASGVSGNDDETDQGDHVYTQSLSFLPINKNQLTQTK